MGIKLVTDTQEKEVTALTDPEVLFVSLVKHAANQMPFRVIKSEEKAEQFSCECLKCGKVIETEQHCRDVKCPSCGGEMRRAERPGPGKTDEKGGENGVGAVVQSLILPKGMTLEMLAAKQGMGCLSEADKEGMEEFDRYTKYVQMPVDKFEKDSLGIRKISKGGAWAITGKLLDQKDAEKALTLSEKLMEIPASPLDKPVAERVIPSTAIPISFGDMFQRELSSFVDVVYGAMSQTASEAKARKSTVMAALESFGSFLSMGLDAVGKAAVEFKGIEKKGEGGFGMLEFKSQEDFAKAVKDIVIAAFDERDKVVQAKAAEEAEKKKKEDEEKKKIEDEAKKKADEDAAKKKADEDEAKKKAAAEDNKSKEEKEKDLKALQAQVKELTEKAEKLEQQIITDPSHPGDPEADKDKKTEKSVFDGLLTRKR